MLEHLKISNYALIEKLDIDFGKGFSVITGETGAGKSIILGALGLLLGGRADAKSIKSGANKCVVEALFKVDGLNLSSIFEDHDIDYDPEGCYIRREVTATGKSRAFINDTPVQVAVLKQISNRLIDIHSQHQNLLMGEENFLLETLDAAGNCSGLLEQYKKAFSQWIDVSRELNDLQKQSEKGQNDLDYLQHRLTLLSEAELVDGEQELLEQESETLNHAEEIKSAFYSASSVLTSDECRPSIALRRVYQSLQSVAQVYHGTDVLLQRLESLKIELDDIADEVERTCESLDFDPQRLAYVDDRLGTIYALQKKFQAETISELLEKEQALRKEIDLIENVDDLLDEKRQRVNALYDALLKSGQALSKQRQLTAQKVVVQLTETLQNLGMPSVNLEFSFTSKNMPDMSGLDSVKLLFSANKNVVLRDVSLVASGGEVARLMLSLKCLLSQYLQLPTVVFDEIDTGVSGTMAEKMAKVMKQMSENCQVLCITHLPQIAALGNQHYKVCKIETEDSTVTQIFPLDTEARVQEIANMLSGEEMTEAAINNAKVLLKI
jgi:DNA repair protein RecN (Recombination protein N)